MDEEDIIEQLEELVRRFGIDICYEPIILDEERINLVGGLCKLRGEKLLIINSRAPARDKIQILAKALSNFDLDQIYIRPAIRGLIERAATTRKLMTASDPAK